MAARLEVSLILLHADCKYYMYFILLLYPLLNEYLFSLQLKGLGYLLYFSLVMRNIGFDDYRSQLSGIMHIRVRQ